MIRLTMKNFPEVITFRITSKCNQNCKYCFGPAKDKKGMDFSELQKLFQLFFKKGVKAIVLTGGEPLLRQDFEEIINELIKYNLKIFLDTNGDLFFKHKDLISGNIDVLGLPIDFVDKSYRNKDNFETTVKILDFYKDKKIHPIIRIGTVVTQDNLNDLNRIGNLLKNYPVDIWKISEFIPQNINALKNKSSLEVPLTEFDKATKRAKKTFSKYFKIKIAERKERSKAYFFVASDGTVFMPVDNLDICREIEIGNIFDKDILEKWEKIVIKDNYFNNVEATFNLKINK